MSHASLSARATNLAQAGQAETDRGKALAKSIKGIERSSETLSSLKIKVKRLDPNQESLDNISTRVSKSRSGNKVGKLNAGAIGAAQENNDDE